MAEDFAAFYAAQSPAAAAWLRELETLLRSGLGSVTAQLAARAIVELVKVDEASKMEALDAIRSNSVIQVFRVISLLALMHLNRHRSVFS